MVYIGQGRAFDFNGRLAFDLDDVIQVQYSLNVRQARDWLADNGWLSTNPDWRPAPIELRPVEYRELAVAPARTPLPKGLVYAYRWSDGSIALLVNRVDTPEGKWVWQMSWIEGVRVLLYGLLPLLNRPDVPV